MAKGLFASPKKALLFAGMTVFAVVMLVGTKDDKGALTLATSGVDQTDARLATQRELEKVERQRRDSGWEGSGMSAFAADEELIDTTEGFDPTPEDVIPYEPETNLGASDAQVVRVEEGDGSGEQF